MKHLPLLIASLLGISAASYAGSPAPQTSPAVATPIYRSHSIDLESGVLWQVGDNTPIDYLLVPTQLSWRTPRMFGFELGDGSTLSVRNRFTFIGTWVAEGPESHYLGFSASPSVEWWNKAESFSIYAGAGGGLGWIDSQDVVGGQGQDQTLNWFAHLGVQTVLTETLSLRAGAMFQHMSNGGATDPNPGIDALGFTIGCSWRF